MVKAVRHDTEYWRDYSHPKRVAWRERMNAPAFGRRRPNWGGCYGVCCGEYTTGGMLCTVCRKYGGVAKCCGYWTVRVNPRIRVPRTSSAGRWKLFLKRFPRFAFDEGLKVVRCGQCGKEYAARHGECPRKHDEAVALVSV